MKFDAKTDARLRILRNAAEVCRLISEESHSWFWIFLKNKLNRGVEIIEREASDE